MKSNQKFMFQNKIYTALSFFGPNNTEYKTSKEAAKANNIREDEVCVVNKEFGGVSFLSECKLINDR